MSRHVKLKKTQGEHCRMPTSNSWFLFATRPQNPLYGEVLAETQRCVKNTSDVHWKQKERVLFEECA